MSEASVANSPPSRAPITAASPRSAGPPPARTRLLLDGPVLPTLLRLAAPNVLNLLAIAGMITFDGLFLGRLGVDVLAGASLAFPFVMLIQHTAASGMGGGVSSAIARALGAGKRGVADALVLHTFVLALALAAAFSGVLLVATPFVFRWMGGHDAILSSALAYANVAFGGAVVAWTGAAIVAAACATIGLIVALLPHLWMGLFTGEPEIIRLGTSYLRIVGPIYGLYGLGMGLYFATQGFGSVIWTVTANAVRLGASTVGALAAITWLDLGASGFFVASAAGFCAYAALTVAAMLKVKQPPSSAAT
jgi:Na+-driven multidrug efflux pump